jgi:hypothetical protein
MLLERFRNLVRSRRGLAGMILVVLVGILDWIGRIDLVRHLADSWPWRLSDSGAFLLSPWFRLAVLVSGIGLILWVMVHPSVGQKGPFLAAIDAVVTAAVETRRILILLLRVVNDGGVASTLVGWRVFIRRPGERQDTELKLFRFRPHHQLKLPKIGYSILSDDGIHDKTFPTPLQPGDARRGWLFAGLDRDTEPGPFYRVKFNDHRGRSYSCEVTAPVKPETEFGHWPGITVIPLAESISSPSPVQPAHPESLAVELTERKFGLGKAITPLGQEIEGAFCILLVTVRNTGAPTAVDAFRLSVTFPNGEKIFGESQDIGESLTVEVASGVKEIYYGCDALGEKTREPIPTGGYVRGRMLYLFPGLKPERLATPGTVLKFELRDTYGRSYAAEKKVIRVQLAGPSSNYPGLKPVAPTPENE